MKCTACSLPIIDEQDGIFSHIHHICDYESPPDATEFDDLIHVINCENVVYYHDNCCVWCSKVPAIVSA